MMGHLSLLILLALFAASDSFAEAGPNTFLNETVRQKLGFPKTSPPAPLPKRASKVSAPVPYAGPSLDESHVASVVGQLRDGNSICTAVLVAPRLVLTAGHCVKGKAPADLRFTLDPRPYWHPATTFAAVSEIRMHPDFHHVSVGTEGGQGLPIADLAMVRLASTDYGAAPREYFPLSVRSGLMGGVSVMGAGYGLNRNGSHSQKRAREMRFAVYLEAADKSGRPLIDAIIVLDPGPGGEAICGGDSGGPLFARINGRLEIVGVASAGAFKERTSPETMCGNANRLVYTNLGPYRSWIQSFFLPTARVAKFSSAMDAGTYLSQFRE